MTHLSVNLNAVAMLRNRRSVPWPSVTGIARIALDAGADGITVHPRPDERHIRRTDVFELVTLLRQDYPGREFNIEGYPTEDFLTLVERAAPDQVTFVPDDPLQATSDHGWHIEANKAVLVPAIERMKAAGIRVSLFINADLAAPAAAARVGADRIELYTGPYGGCYDNPAEAEAWAVKLGATSSHADSLGLDVNAGHDLTVANLPLLCRHVPKLAEVSIGHGLTADALEYGMAETVRRFRRALGETI